MIRTLSVCAGVALATSVASATFLGIELRTDPIVNASATSTINDGQQYHVLRMFAVFDSADEVLSVGQPDDITGFGVQASGGAFFQTPGPFGADTAPNSGFFAIPGAETLPYDTFVSLGITDSSGGDSTLLDGDFGFEDLSAGDSLDDFIRGGWANSDPTNTQGETIPSGGAFETFLGQFTITGMSSAILPGGPAMLVENNALDGELTVFVQIPGGGVTPFTVNFTSVPTPGATALFGIAGLTFSRRRRSA